jgi:hypothetical protein
MRWCVLNNLGKQVLGVLAIVIFSLFASGERVDACLILLFTIVSCWRSEQKTRRHMERELPDERKEPDQGHTEDRGAPFR